MNPFVAGAAVVIVAAAATTAEAATLDASKLEAFQPGITTKAEVIASLGRPSSGDLNPSTGGVLMYDFKGARGTPQAGKALIIAVLFDGEGKLIRYRIYVQD
jgi:hypothetical protein